MILQFAPTAPLLLRAAAGAALVLHITGASTALAAGLVALFARKGGRTHKLSGTVFFVAMLAMGSAAALTAPFLPDRVSALMGLFVVYLAATGWMTVQRGPMSVGRFETAMVALPLIVAAGDFAVAAIGLGAPEGLVDGEPSQVGWIFGTLAVLAALSDLSMIRRGGLAGPKRIARHLWRMTLALAIAWGSFAGQPKAQPAFLKGSPLIILPALIVVAMLVFWLIRTLWRRQPRRRAIPA
ncbi:MAG TPA: hypothetical protein VGC92_11670 [Phenylobacterium sp.]|jgi:uncharacterized membrane protein